MTIRTWKYKSDFARRHYGRGFADGFAKGATRAVLAYLSARGIDVPEAARDRIRRCTDLEQLDTWISRVVTVTTVDELFA